MMVLRAAAGVLAAGAAAVTISIAASAVPSDSPVAIFESGQVRPLAMSPDGTLLFAVNTPDNRLEIFSVTQGRQARGSIPVGLEPVAVAARTDSEVWVVNHLSDSVSVVDVDAAATGRVVRTLLVGDEPRDIVFAGPRTEARVHHDGPSRPEHPDDPAAHDAGRGARGRVGVRRDDLGDAPRRHAADDRHALQRHAARARGHPRRRTRLRRRLPLGQPDDDRRRVDRCRTAFGTGGLPGPPPNAEGAPRREVGLIVKCERQPVGRRARPQLGQRREILAARQGRVRDRRDGQPARASRRGGRYFPGVGTILFNMAVNPVSGKVYVSNTEALNEVRFEGPGLRRRRPCAATSTRAASPCSDGGTVTPRHLNKHIDYDACCAPIPNDEKREPRAAPGNGGQRRRRARSTSRRSARARSASSTRRSSRTTRSSRAPRPDRRDAAAGRPGSCSTKTEPPLRAYALRQLDLGRRHANRGARSRTSRCTIPSRHERS